MTGRLRVASAGLSETGKVRTINEDAWLARPDLGVWAVADGMGGHSRGDLASHLIVEALGTIAPPADARDLRQAVEERLLQVNRRLLSLAQPGEVIGSTVALLLLHGRHYAVLWAGDSRVYLARRGRLAQLSRDHSLVQEMVDQGRLSAAASADHPLGNIVSRAVGAGHDLVLEAVHGEVAPYDCFLLCSDGLTRHLDDGHIGRCLDGPPSAIAARLIDATLADGATDNVTAVVVSVLPAI